MDEEARYPFSKHKEEMVVLIKSLPYESDDKLHFFLDELEDGRWLKLHQEKHLRERAANPNHRKIRRRRVPSAHKGDVIRALNRLEEKATKNNEEWAIQFAKSIRDRVRQDQGLSKRQRDKLEEKCADYDVTLPSLS